MIDCFKWIPVSERLPEHMTRVAVWRGKEKSWIGFIVKLKETNTWFINYGDKCIPVSDITHWMPLPEPPT